VYLAAFILQQWCRHEYAIFIAKMKESSLIGWQWGKIIIVLKDIPKGRHSSRQPGIKQEGNPDCWV